MLVLVDGAFGIGKTTLVEGLQNRLPHTVVFDPEWVGAMIRATVGAIDPRDDFQQYPVWQEWVVESVRALRRHYHETLLLPICLYLPNVAGLPEQLRAIDPEFRHLLLIAPSDVVRARLLARGAGEEWGIARADAICEAHAKLEFVTRIDATLPPEAVLERALAAIVTR